MDRNVNQYMLATGCLSGISLFLHLISAGNFLPDEEVWLLGTVFWYIHYWMNAAARLLLLGATATIGLEIYRPNMIGSYASMDNRKLKKYWTKILSAATLCIFIRFVLPGPVTSFGRLYKLCFMTSLSAAVITVIESNEIRSGGGGSLRRSWGMKKKQGSEDTGDQDDEMKRRLGESKKYSSFKNK